MDIEKLKSMSIEDRKSVFDSESIGVEEASYLKPLTKQELIDKKDQFSQAAIDKATIESEFKDVRDEYKGRLKPIQAIIDSTREVIKQRGQWTKGQCHKIPDYENKIVHIVDTDGNVISSRMMKPEERQFMIGQKHAV